MLWRPCQIDVLIVTWLPIVRKQLVSPWKLNDLRIEAASHDLNKLGPQFNIAQLNKRLRSWYWCRIYGSACHAGYWPSDGLSHAARQSSKRAWGTSQCRRLTAVYSGLFPFITISKKSEPGRWWESKVTRTACPLPSAHNHRCWRSCRRTPRFVNHNQTASFNSTRRALHTTLHVASLAAWCRLSNPWHVTLLQDMSSLTTLTFHEEFLDINSELILS